MAAANSTNKLPRELISRFGKPLQIPPYSKNEFEIIVRNMLTRKLEVSQSLADYIAMRLVQNNDYNVRSALQIARMSKYRPNPFQAANLIFEVQEENKFYG